MTTLIGLGSLARAVYKLLPKDRTFHGYTRTKKTIEAFPGLYWRDPQTFNHEDTFILFLPGNEIGSFFNRYYDRFKEGTTFYYTATALLKEDVEPYLPRGTKAVPWKWVTQADALAAQGNGLAVTESEEEAERLGSLFGDLIRTLPGKEEDVLTVNKEATWAAIRAVVQLKKDLRSKGIQDDLIDQAASQILPGVIDAYLDGKLGGFGKQAAKELENDET
ncbi:hypothetical protein [Alteribacter natronophilus]|uniref:hypothetical protein n=1 Tax=Alteribacter natronophilus TaxID=2583810 RepID=UPI00110F1B55|nr:hypothetical protein [Alteribacter natronophilus]TMW71784.1 hypothetical protein FGB90_12240 [Alteribacter natronophilus]